MADFVEEEIVRHEWTGNTDNISYVGLLIRCKDCKKHGQENCPMCKKYTFVTADNWYCYEGERKTVNE